MSAERMGRRTAPWWAAVLAGCMAAFVPAGAGAQGLRIQAEIDANVTVTDNPRLIRTDLADADVVLTVFPRLTFTSRGGRAALDGSFGLEAVNYADNSDFNSVRPRGNIGLRTELVERAVFFDASIFADRTVSNDYGPRGGEGSAVNDYAFVRYRAAPSIERALSPQVNLLIRSDQVWTRRVGTDPSATFGITDQTRDSDEQEQLARLERRPTPLGFTAEALRSSSELVDAGSVVLEQTAARLIGTYALDQQVVVGLGIGREEAEYGTVQQRDTIKTLRVNWRPTERSTFDTTLEKRYFGKGLQANWRHRGAQFGFELRGDRQPRSNVGTFVVGAAGSDVPALLDGILAARYPNPGERAGIVNDLIRDLNLPGSLLAPLDLYTAYAQLDESASGSILFLGRVTTASLTTYWRRRTALAGLSVFLSPAALTGDSVQRGLSWDFTRRLSPVLSANTQLSYSRIEGLAAFENTATREIVLRVGVTRLLAPNTRGTAGLRVTDISSTVAGRAKETAASVGLLHQF